METIEDIKVPEDLVLPLNINIPTLSMVLRALSKLPYDQVVGVIGDLEHQANGYITQWKSARFMATQQTKDSAKASTTEDFSQKSTLNE